MALTSNDETDLLLPLFRGAQENPGFATFLERLRRRTGAVHAGLILQHDETPAIRRSALFAGLDLVSLAGELGIADLNTLEASQHDRLRPGRVYAAREFTDHDPSFGAERAAGIGALGVRDERVVRVIAASGLDAWLTIAGSRPFNAADGALLSNLVPYLAEALATFVVLESRRTELAVANEGMSRLGTGWILFEANGRVLSVDSGTAERLRSLAGIAVQPGERIRDLDHRAERELSTAAADYTADPGLSARAIVLCEEPRIEALLSAAHGEDVTATQTPALLALCRFPARPSADRSQRLAQLFDLPRREAELAIALCEGQTIAEAGRAMGITLETARNYSKRLYSKLGVRGQAELVRLVYESSAVLA